MTHRIPAILLAPILFFALPVAAQVRHQMAMEQAPPEISGFPEAGPLEIPLELVNNHLLIPISIDGSAPFRVILDTGMPIGGVMLYETERVEAMDLPYGPMRAMVGGAGGDGKHVEARIAGGLTVEIAGMRIEKQNAIVLPPMHGFHSYHDGVIGTALFRNFVVEIDYDDEVVRLHDKEAYRPAENAGVQQLDLETGYPFTDVTVTTTDGKTMVFNVVVDLGASHPFSLNTDSDERIVVPGGAVTTVIGKGIGGLLHGRVARLAGLELGGRTLRNVVTTYPQSGQQNHGGMNFKNGNLGNGILRRFNVTFDYAHERMLLEPSRRFAKPFEHDMSGMYLDENDEGQIVVRELVPGSPAAEAGLKVDDRVTHLNGDPVTPETLHGFRDRLREEGAEITVGVMREDGEVDLEMRLRRLV